MMIERSHIHSALLPPLETICRPENRKSVRSWSGCMYALLRSHSIVALIIVQPAVSHGEPVAHILDVKGKVTVTNDGKVRSAEVFGQISVGEKVRFDPKSALVLAWRIDRPADNRVERFTTGDKAAQVPMGPDKLDT